MERENLREKWNIRELPFLGRAWMKELNSRLKNGEDMEENDLGFTLNPDPGMLRGNLLAFSIGENGKPVDTSLSRFRRSKKNLRKRQLGDAKEESKEEKEEDESNQNAVAFDPDSLEVHIQGMPYEVTEDDVRKFFEGCGTIQEVRLSR